MKKLDSVVIAGGGLAGATAAFALRERGLDGGITLVSQEQSAPYERPPRSKGYLRGESTMDPVAGCGVSGREVGGRCCGERTTPAVGPRR